MSTAVDLRKPFLKMDSFCRSGGPCVVKFSDYALGVKSQLHV